LCLVGDIDRLPRSRGRPADLTYLATVWIKAILSHVSDMMPMVEACEASMKTVRAASRVYLMGLFHADQDDREGDCELGLAYGMLNDDVSFLDGGVFFSVQAFTFPGVYGYHGLPRWSENIMEGGFIEAVQ
jgi:hypothetical protein